MTLSVSITSLIAVGALLELKQTDGTKRRSKEHDAIDVRLNSKSG